MHQGYLEIHLLMWFPQQLLRRFVEQFFRNISFVLFVLREECCQDSSAWPTCENKSCVSGFQCHFCVNKSGILINEQPSKLRPVMEFADETSWSAWLMVNLSCSCLTCKKDFAILVRGTLRSSHIFVKIFCLLLKQNTFRNPVSFFSAQMSLRITAELLKNALVFLKRLESFWRLFPRLPERVLGRFLIICTGTFLFLIFVSHILIANRGVWETI